MTGLKEKVDIVSLQITKEPNNYVDLLGLHLKSHNPGVDLRLDKFCNLEDLETFNVSPDFLFIEIEIDHLRKIYSKLNCVLNQSIFCAANIIWLINGTQKETQHIYNFIREFSIADYALFRKGTGLGDLENYLSKVCPSLKAPISNFHIKKCEGDTFLFASCDIIILGPKRMMIESDIDCPELERIKIKIPSLFGEVSLIGNIKKRSIYATKAKRYTYLVDLVGDKTKGMIGEALNSELLQNNPKSYIRAAALTRDMNKKTIAEMAPNFINYYYENNPELHIRTLLKRRPEFIAIEIKDISQEMAHLKNIVETVKGSGPSSPIFYIFCIQDVDRGKLEAELKAQIIWVKTPFNAENFFNYLSVINQTLIEKNPELVKGRFLSSINRTSVGSIGVRAVVKSISKYGINLESVAKGFTGETAHLEHSDYKLNPIRVFDEKTAPSSYDITPPGVSSFEIEGLWEMFNGLPSVEDISSVLQQIFYRYQDDD